MSASAVYNVAQPPPTPSKLHHGLPGAVAGLVWERRRAGMRWVFGAKICGEGYIPSPPVVWTVASRGRHPLSGKESLEMIFSGHGPISHVLACIMLAVSLPETYRVNRLGMLGRIMPGMAGTGQDGPVLRLQLHRQGEEVDGRRSALVLSAPLVNLGNCSC